MTEINLLPWRDTLRDAIKKEFLIILAGVFICSVVILIIGMNVVKSKIQRQNEINIALQKDIALLEIKISTTKTIKAELNNLTAKQNSLEKLQLERVRTVHLLEQVTYQVPPGMYLIRFEKKGDQLIFEGVAESNELVSEFMRKIAQSKWLAEPHLMEIKVARDKEDSKGFYFKIGAKCVIAI